MEEYTQQIVSSNTALLTRGIGKELEFGIFCKIKEILQAIVPYNVLVSSVASVPME